MRRAAIVLGFAALISSGLFGINVVPVLAFNCPSGGSTTVQGNAYATPAASYDLHGWLGNCATGNPNWWVQWYGGEDSRTTWGGSWHNVSYMSIHLRVWVCGSLQYDQTAAYYNRAYISLVAPQYFYGPNCSPQADASGYETVTGVWGWSWYLTPPFP